MKIAILSVQVPFITGGAELHASALKAELIRRGCEAEIVTLPFKWYPPERLLDCMLAARLTDVEEVNGLTIDRVIALKFPAYFAPHRERVCWILHQHRQAYDLYGTPLSDLSQTEQGRAVAAEIKRWDDEFLPQSRALFANSRTVAERLKRYNNLAATPLYHPPFNHEAFRTGRFDPYIFYPGRFDTIKRQHLLVEALAHLPGDLRIVLCGQTDSAYGKELLRKIDSSPSRDRIQVLGRISEAEKIDFYANCLAVYNGVYDEDYGYITLEAFCAGKAVVTHHDSGGPLEFVVDGVNGYITEPDAAELAGALAKLMDEPQARRMGAAGQETFRSANINWDYVIDRLLAA
ncbi:MAG: glycosyltransferase family 4 protein [Verrucomicrobiota bacterium]|nr:glycosyltransferase family 4 protein [Verrucomicrobiota bacterium]